jgi:hypothetical protein
MNRLEIKADSNADAGKLKQKWARFTDEDFQEFSVESIADEMSAEEISPCCCN